MSTRRTLGIAIPEPVSNVLEMPAMRAALAPRIQATDYFLANTTFGRLSGFAFCTIPATGVGHRLAAPAAVCVYGSRLLVHHAANP